MLAVSDCQILEGVPTLVAVWVLPCLVFYPAAFFMERSTSGINVFWMPSYQNDNLCSCLFHSVLLYVASDNKDGFTTEPCNHTPKNFSVYVVANCRKQQYIQQVFSCDMKVKVNADHSVITSGEGCCNTSMWMVLVEDSRSKYKLLSRLYFWGCKCCDLNSLLCTYGSLPGWFPSTPLHR